MVRGRTTARSIPEATRPVQRITIDAGYQPSVAAVTLQRFGLVHATDLIGGFRAWSADGMPIVTQRRG